MIPNTHRSVATLAPRLCGKVSAFVKKNLVRSEAKAGAALPARKVIDYGVQIARGLAAATPKASSTAI